MASGMRGLVRQKTGGSVAPIRPLRALQATKTDRNRGSGPRRSIHPATTNAGGGQRRETESGTDHP
jgi:hypothetical protein